MRSYIGLTGRGDAFGWGKRNAQGEYEITLGGLSPRTVYALGSKERAESDSRGNIKRVVACMPLYVADGAGAVVLHDAGRLSYEEARMLALPAEAPVSAPAAAETAETPSETLYRTRLHDAPVDALPKRVWPRGHEKLRALTESGKPAGILPYPWRFTVIPGSGGMCFAGYAAKHGRVVKTAYAVRARGGLMQPKALQGYRFIRSEAGENYWMYVQSVNPADE